MVQIAGNHDGGLGTPERQVVFDINDFDETLPGPWEWDLKRLVTSVAIAGRHIALRERRRADGDRHGACLPGAHGRLWIDAGA